MNGCFRLAEVTLERLQQIHTIRPCSRLLAGAAGTEHLQQGPAVGLRGRSSAK